MSLFHLGFYFNVGRQSSGVTQNIIEKKPKYQLFEETFSLYVVILINF